MANDKLFQVKHGLRASNISFQDSSGSSVIIEARFDELTDTLSFEGDAGQLFSLSDNLTGSLFTVNDISGMPSIEVLDNGNIILAETSGNVGIGTSSPATALDVVGTVTADGLTIESAGTIQLTQNTTAAGDLLGRIEFHDEDAVTGDGGVVRLEAIRGGDVDAPDFQIISTTNGGVLTNRLFLESATGNIGIGTSSPTEELTVGSGGSNYIGIGGDGVNASGIRFYRGASTVDGLIEIDANEDMIISMDNTGSLGTGQILFKTGNTERMRIDSKGMLGLGSTPPTDAHATWSQFFIGEKGSVISEKLGSGGLYGLWLTDNGYVDNDTGNFSYRTTDEASSINLEAGETIFYRAASGTAGDALTWSESMRIDSSGNVGINVTNPQVKLHVQHDVAEMTGSLVDTTTKATLHLKTHATDTTITSFGGVLGGHGYIQRSNGAGTTSYGLLLNPYGGNVGIGTTSPATALDVAGDITLGDTNPTITFNDSSIANLSHTISSSSDNLRIMADVNGVDVGSRVEIFDGTTEVARFQAGAVDITGTVTTDDIYVGAGSATSPSVQMNDTNSGLFAPAGNTIAFSTAGGERVRITSAGNVGIGASSPSSVLTVVTSSNANNIQIRRDSITTSDYAQLGFSVSTGTTADNNAEIRAIRTNSPNAGDTEIAFLNRGSGVGPTEHLRITSAGNVGIGTTTPGRLLELKESSTGAGDAIIRLRGHGNDANNTPLGSLEWFNTDPSGDQPGVVAAIEAQSDNPSGHMGKLLFKTHDGSEGGEGSSPVERMRITSAGNVGIGTNTPARPFHALAADDPSRFERSTTATISEQGVLELKATTSGDMGNDFGPYMSYVIEDNAATENVIGYHGFRRTNGQDNSSRFYITTYNAGTEVESLIIDSDGKVGIGTNAPYAKLHVEGEIKGNGWYGAEQGRTTSLIFDLDDDGDVTAQSDALGLGNLSIPGLTASQIVSSSLTNDTSFLNDSSTWVYRPHWNGIQPAEWSAIGGSTVQDSVQDLNTTFGIQTWLGPSDGLTANRFGFNNTAYLGDTFRIGNIRPNGDFISGMGFSGTTGSIGSFGSKIRFTQQSIPKTSNTSQTKQEFHDGNNGVMEIIAGNRLTFNVGDTLDANFGNIFIDANTNATKNQGLEIKKSGSYSNSTWEILNSDSASSGFTSTFEDQQAVLTLIDSSNTNAIGLRVFNTTKDSDYYQSGTYPIRASIGFGFARSEHTTDQVFTSPAISYVKEGSFTGTTQSKNASLRFSTLSNSNTIEALVIKPTGNVGIGTNDPKSNLNVSAAGGATLTIENLSSMGLGTPVGEIDFYANDGSTNGTGVKANIRAISTISSGAAVGLTFGTSTSAEAAAVERMRIDDDGKVGIGSTNPKQILDVNGRNILLDDYTAVGRVGSSAASIFGHNAVAGTSANQTISGNSSWHSHFIRMYYDEGIAFHVSIDSSGTAGDVLHDQDTPSNEVSYCNEAMRIDIGGKVGIGTTYATSRLHLKTVAPISNTVNDVLTIETYRSDVTAFNGGAIVFRNGDTNSGGQARIKVGSENDGSTGLNLEQSASFIFETGDGQDTVTSSITGGTGSYVTFVHNAFPEADLKEGDVVAVQAGSYLGSYTVTTVTSSTQFTALDRLGRDFTATAQDTTARSLYTTYPKDSMIIRADGDVGIGTVTPVVRLHVHDPEQVVGGKQLVLQGGDGGYGAGISFQTVIGGSGGTRNEMAKITADGNNSFNTTTATQDAELRFYTTNDGAIGQRMVIDNFGRVGINTTSVSTGRLLDIYNANNGDCQAIIYGAGLTNTNSSYWRAQGRDTSTLNIRGGELGVYKHSGITSSCAYIKLDPQDGNTGYYWTDDNDQLEFSTNAANIGKTTGSIVGLQTSDERLKNIDSADFSYGIKTVKQLKPIRFAFKKDPDKFKLGFGAQTTLPIVPEAVLDTYECIDGYEQVETLDSDGKPSGFISVPKSDNPETKLNMEYVTLIPVLTKAIQEQQAMIESLTARIEELENR